MNQQKYPDVSKLERIMEAITSHVGLLEPDAEHPEETHMSHTDDKVQEGGSQDGFSDEDCPHLNSDLAGNSISRGDMRILPEEFLDSESSKKQKLSEFSENFDCDQESIPILSSSFRLATKAAYLRTY